jgi:hypothetical protein
MTAKCRIKILKHFVAQQEEPGIWLPLLDRSIRV